MVRVGDVFETKYGKVTVIDYENCTNVTVKFEDGTVVVCRSQHLRSGVLKNPNGKSIHNTGCLGMGEFKTDNRVYFIWQSILNPKRKLSSTIDERWLNFQHFYTDVMSIPNSEFAIVSDWDFSMGMLKKGNKHYSLENCCFVPHLINLTVYPGSKKSRGDLPIGVSRHKDRYRSTITINKQCIYIGLFDTPEGAFYAYKEIKEKQIKKLADVYKESLEPRVYKALIQHSVDITD